MCQQDMWAAASHALAMAAVVNRYCLCYTKIIMSMKDQLQQDLKSAMLARDSFKTDVIKGLKSAILYAEVATNKREQGLGDAEILAVMRKESKKRQESADMYNQGGSPDKADKEMQEKLIIDAYLPQQMSEAQVVELIDTVLQKLDLSAPTKQDMGRIIGEARAVASGEVDGSMLAKLVSERLS